MRSRCEQRVGLPFDSWWEEMRFWLSFSFISDVFRDPDFWIFLFNITYQNISQLLWYKASRIYYHSNNSVSLCLTERGKVSHVDYHITHRLAVWFQWNEHYFAYQTVFALIPSIALTNRIVCKQKFYYSILS